MAIEWDENIPPHERVTREINNNHEGRIWLVKGMKNDRGTTEIIKVECGTKKDALEEMKRLKGSGAVCFVCGPFEKNEKGQLLHCAPVNKKRKHGFENMGD